MQHWFWCHAILIPLKFFVSMTFQFLVQLHACDQRTCHINIGWISWAFFIVLHLNPRYFDWCKWTNAISIFIVLMMEVIFCREFRSNCYINQLSPTSLIYIIYIYIYTSVAQSKIVVSQVLNHWRYHSFTLRHQDMLFYSKNNQETTFGSLAKNMFILPVFERTGGASHMIKISHCNVQGIPQGNRLSLLLDTLCSRLVHNGL